MKQLLLLSLLCFILTGCVTDQMAAQYASCNNYSTWVESAQCTDKISANDLRLTQEPTAQEIISYRRLLIEQVQKGKMTDAEARYAFQQKVGEMNQRLAQQRALNQLSQPANIQSTQQAPAYQIPLSNRTTTTCQQMGNQFVCQESGIRPLDTSALGNIKSIRDFQ